LRWQLDGGRFHTQLFFQDFVARSGTVLDGHAGNVLYYLDILQRHHYDWLTVAAASLLLFPVPWRQMRSAAVDWWRDHHDLALLMLAWVFITLLVPTLMATKLPWYLNPFYPPFAIGVGALAVRGLSMQGRVARRRTLAALLTVVVLVAEGKLIWTSYVRRDPSRSVQGLLFAERHEIRGQRVYRERWNNAEVFVLDALIGAHRGLAKDLIHFLRESCPGDYFVSTPDLNHPDLTIVRRNAGRALYRRKL
jgi:hypothetical protein